VSTVHLSTGCLPLVIPIKLLAEPTDQLALRPGEALIIRAHDQDVLVDPALTFDLFGARRSPP
jgi:hypothetical protein